MHVANDLVGRREENTFERVIVRLLVLPATDCGNGTSYLRALLILHCFESDMQIRVRPAGADDSAGNVVLLTTCAKRQRDHVAHNRRAVWVGHGGPATV
jgi:hypothetical protein